MKKVILVFCLFVGFAAATAAQPRAIGGRVGWALEASYQHEVMDDSYFQIDAGFPGYSLGLHVVGTYNWIFATPQWGRYGKWEWFAGVGGGTGVWWDGDFFMGVAGNFGLSFTFPFDLQLSTDFRPVVGPVFKRDGSGFYDYGLWGFGLSVRYAF